MTENEARKKFAEWGLAMSEVEKGHLEMRGTIINAMLANGMTEAEIEQILDEPESLAAINKMALEAYCLAQAYVIQQRAA